MTPNPDTIDAGATLDDAVERMLAGNRRWAPVLDGDRYAGLLAVTDIVAVPQAAWPTTGSSASVARTDVPPAAPGDTVFDAGARMRASGLHAVAVIDDDRVVGVVTQRDVANVEVLLDRLTEDVDDDG